MKNNIDFERVETEQLLQKHISLSTSTDLI